MHVFMQEILLFHALQTGLKSKENLLSVYFAVGKGQWEAFSKQNIFTNLL